MSQDLGRDVPDLEKLYARKLWADLSFPIFVAIFLRGEAFFVYLKLELFCLQLSFFAYSPLRPLLDTLSHCKQTSSNCK